MTRRCDPLILEWMAAEGTEWAVMLVGSLSGIARLLFLPLLICSLLVEFCISAVVHAGVFAGVTVGFWLLFRFSADW